MHAIFKKRMVGSHHSGFGDHSPGANEEQARRRVEWLVLNSQVCCEWVCMLPQSQQCKKLCWDTHLSGITLCGILLIFHIAKRVPANGATLSGKPSTYLDCIGLKLNPFSVTRCLHNFLILLLKTEGNKSPKAADSSCPWTARKSFLDFVGKRIKAIPNKNINLKGIWGERSLNMHVYACMTHFFCLENLPAIFETLAQEMFSIANHSSSLEWRAGILKRCHNRVFLDTLCGALLTQRPK